MYCVFIRESKRQRRIWTGRGKKDAISFTDKKWYFYYKYIIHRFILALIKNCDFFLKIGNFFILEYKVSWCIVMIYESPCIRRYEWKGWGVYNRFLRGFYLLFDEEFFFGPLVNYDRLVEKTGFRAWGGKLLFSPPFPLPSPSLLFFPRGKNEVVPDIYTYVTFMVSLWRTVSHGAISDKIKQLGDNLLRRGN